MYDIAWHILAYHVIVFDVIVCVCVCARVAGVTVHTVTIHIHSMPCHESVGIPVRIARQGTACLISTIGRARTIRID